MTEAKTTTHRVTFAGSGDAFGSGGRLNTCFVVEGPGKTVAIDFGASSLIALNKAGIAHRDIDAVILSHIHGDHSAGIPFMLVDAMLGARREKPLTIAGPYDTKARLAEAMEVLFPGSHVMTPKFPVTYVEMELMRENAVMEGVTCTPYPAQHPGATNPTSLRATIEGKVIAYTGDTAWTEHLPAVATGADLFIAECYFHSKAVKFHLNYPDLMEHRDDLTAKRMILTHMGPEMLAQADAVPEETAYDGLVVEI